MKEFRGKVAVVTGAASGIGRGLAEACAREGMKVVPAVVDEASLTQTERELKDSGADVLAVRTDVSKADEVEALAQESLAAFGAAPAGDVEPALQRGQAHARGRGRDGQPAAGRLRHPDRRGRHRRGLE